MSKRFILKTCTLLGGERELGSNPSLTNPGIMQSRESRTFSMSIEGKMGRVNKNQERAFRSTPTHVPISPLPSGTQGNMLQFLIKTVLQKYSCNTAATSENRFQFIH